jgi:hypothetical protein
MRLLGTLGLKHRPRGYASGHFSEFAARPSQHGLPGCDTESLSPLAIENVLVPQHMASRPRAKGVRPANPSISFAFSSQPLNREIGPPGYVRVFVGIRVDGSHHSNEDGILLSIGQQLQRDYGGQGAPWLAVHYGFMDRREPNKNLSPTIEKRRINMQRGSVGVALSI